MRIVGYWLDRFIGWMAHEEWVRFPRLDSESRVCFTFPMAQDARFGVRVGDDGRWHGKFASLDEAEVFAGQFSLENSLGRAQVVDFQTGARQTWEDGERIR